MILADIKRYLDERGQANLAELSRRFDSDPEAMRGMLDFWVARGRVIRWLPSCGGGCTQCAPEAIEVYSWVKNTSTSGKAIPLRPPECREGRTGCG